MKPLSLPFVPRISALKPLLMASLCHHQISKNYSKDRGHGMSERARSTAEEFTRQAKEKAESVSQGAKEAWDGVEEAAAGSSEEKEKFKKIVEKGNNDKIGNK